MVTPYQLDVVIYHTATSLIVLVKLTCPLDLGHHLQSARSCKQCKVEYLKFLAELDHLNISNFYETLEVSVLGHYYPFCVKNLWSLLYFIHQDVSVSKETVGQMLDDALWQCIAASQKIFMAQDYCKWPWAFSSVRFESSAVPVYSNYGITKFIVLLWHLANPRAMD